MADKKIQIIKPVKQMDNLRNEVSADTNRDRISYGEIIEIMNGAAKSVGGCLSWNYNGSYVKRAKVNYQLK